MSGVWKVLGSLAISGAIGDRYLRQRVTAEPETKVLKLEPEYDEFLLHASDGLWDKVSNQEAVDIARPLCANIDKPRPLSACRKLVEPSVSRGSSDDISVMLTQFGRFLYRLKYAFRIWVCSHKKYKNLPSKLINF